MYAKSCLKAKGCTDAGTAEEPVDNFGQMTIFAQPDDGGANAPAQATAAPLAPGTATGVMTQVRWEWSLTGVLGATRGIPYVGAIISVLYVPSAGEGSRNAPERDEFWYEEELRQKALTGAKATTRVNYIGLKKQKMMEKPQYQKR
ncbi:hypothetical protein VXK49_003086 [Salmonella enterica]|nr:hypothetical protein [Salmonella enterica]EBQ4835213.1 hypothetical protein [Salmonella enterica subsp. arizonae]EDR1379881.1 hypothetical protein [Salmonella enterica subsp. diarizonae serovar 61:r:z53]EDV2801772.1 hypothetical protein [Salmonella enterica subsp. diarizonae]EEP9415176.1 hypothetical protein [Salmonella enterica]